MDLRCNLYEQEIISKAIYVKAFVGYIFSLLIVFQNYVLLLFFDDVTNIFVAFFIMRILNAVTFSVLPF